jgi:shikimate dehydrogenase
LEKFKAQGFTTHTHATIFPASASSTLPPVPRFDLIVNMTSAGLTDESLPAPKPILDTLIPQAKACIDVIYGHNTPFLQLAQSYNKPTTDGSEMLLQQGVIAFDLFTGGEYEREEIERAMRRVFEIG